MAALKPTINEKARQAICPECGGQVKRRSPTGPFPKFCCDEHKKTYGNRLLAQGLPVIALLKAWRKDRGTGEIAQKAFAQVCQIVDQFNAEDDAAGRPRPDLYAAKLMHNSSLYIDRARPKGPRARAEVAEEPAPEPQNDLLDILAQIASGHNDARRLAEEALARAAA
jgi:hypothetical protein